MMIALLIALHLISPNDGIALLIALHLISPDDGIALLIALHLISPDDDSSSDSTPPDFTKGLYTPSEKRACNCATIEIFQCYYF